MGIARRHARCNLNVAKIMTMQIRPYENTDFAAIVELWQECGIAVPHNDPAYDIPKMVSSSNCQLYLGIIAEAIVASIMVGHDGHRGWIYKLAVASEHRRQGHAATLVRQAENWLTARGIRKCQLMIRADNAAVRRLYSRLGYEDMPRLMMSKWLDAQRPEMAASMLDVVVTYLEMTERPTRPAVPAPAGHYALLRLDHPTADYYRYLYNTVGEPWMWVDRRRLDDAALLAEISHEKVEIYVLYAGGVPAGYVELDRRPEPDINIAYFGLFPNFIGRGLGKYLLSWAVERAWSYGPQRLTVETCTLDHARALGEYQRAGFKPIRQAAKKILDPRLEGLIPATVTPPLHGATHA